MRLWLVFVSISGTTWAVSSTSTEKGYLTMTVVSFIARRPVDEGDTAPRQNPRRRG
jgi:hypothetical protein